MRRKNSDSAEVATKKSKNVPGIEVVKELNKASLSESPKKKATKIPEVLFSDDEMKHWAEEYIKATSDKKIAESDMKEYGEFFRHKMEKARLKYCHSTNSFVKSLNFEGKITFAMPRVSVIQPVNGETIEGKQLLAVALFGVDLAKKYFRVETMLKVKDGVAKSMDMIHRLERLCNGRGTEEDLSEHRFNEMFEYCSELTLTSRVTESGEEVVCLEEDMSMEKRIFDLVENGINNHLLSLSTGTIRVSEKALVSSTR